MAGCRTYGGYDTEQKSLAKLAELNERFAQALERARTDVESLQSVAAARPQFKAYATRYERIVDQHAHLVETQLAAYDDLAGRRLFYRRVSSVLGATITEQNAIFSAYSAVVEDAAASAGIAVPSVRPASDYVKAPPYYERIRYEVVRPTLDEVVRTAR